MKRPNKSEAIEQEMRRKINSGEWAPASKIPSEAELCGEFQVSRITIRAALNTLRAEKLLLSRPKIGTLVSSVANRPVVVVLARQEDIMAPYGYWYRDLAMQVERHLRRDGYNLMLITGFGATAPEMIETLENYYIGALRSAAGIVAVSTVREELAAYLNRPGMPPWSGLSVGAPIAGTLFADYATLQTLVKELFAAHGVAEFATMYPSMIGLAEEDQACWRERLMYDSLRTEQKRHREDFLVPVPYSVELEAARDSFLAWWSRPKRPQGLFIADDAIFDVLSLPFVEMKLHFPADLALVVFANVGRTFMSPATPCRIGQNPDTVAAELLKLLYQRLCRPELPAESICTNWELQSGTTLPAI